MATSSSMLKNNPNEYDLEFQRSTAVDQGQLSRREEF
jgi:hypothetical protein